MYLIASIGPRTIEEENIKKMIESGTDTIRISFAHTSHDKISNIVKFLRSKYPEVKIIADIQGNKIRVSNKLRSVFRVDEGEEVYFCGEDGYDVVKEFLKEHEKKIIPLNINGSRLRNGKIDKIYMKDGTMEFEIIEIRGEIVRTVVKCGGVVRREKGCNIPKITRVGIGLSEKDRNDIKFSLKHNFDILIYSYTSYKEDIENFKNAVFENKPSNVKAPKIWSKVENIEGIENLEEIAKVCDGIVIGRGDLIPESNLTVYPLLQKSIINTMQKNKKDLIIATHVLESMEKRNKPSISEVDCIFNLMINGVSGFLLAKETTIGDYPFEAINYLRRFTDYYLKIIKS